jgi:hypothetical protein
VAGFGHPAREHRRNLTCLTLLPGRVRSWEAPPISGYRVRMARRCAEDDEVDGYSARSAPAMLAPPICRGSRRNESRPELILRHSRFVGFGEGGGYPSEHRSERSEPLDNIELGAEQSNTVTVLRCPVIVVTVTTVDCGDLWHFQTP